MEKVFTNEISRFLFLLGLGVVAFFALVGQMISRIQGSFEPFQKSTLIYLVASLFCFALVAMIGWTRLFGSIYFLFLAFQLLFLGLGILHVRLMHKYLKWSGETKAFWLELLFTIVVALLGSIGFFLVCRLAQDASMTMTAAASIFTFIIPVLFYHSFLRAIAIPAKIFKQWYYPIHEEVAEPEESRLKNLYIISFQFLKNVGDQHFTNFRAKAPRDMEFGQLFYHFINDYNDRHPDDKIKFLNEGGEPDGWIFYRKPRWYSIFTIYKDPEKTVFINNIRENDIIICNRCIK